MSEFPERFNVQKNATSLNTRIDNTTVGTRIGGYVRFIGNSDNAPDPQFVIGAGTSNTTSIITAYLNYATGAVVDTTWGTGTTGIYTFVTANMTVAAFTALVNASTNWRFVASGLLPDELMFVVGNGTSTSVTLTTAVTAASANAKACRTPSGTVLYCKLLGTNNDNTICCGLEAQDGSVWGDVLGRVAERTARIGVTKDLSDYTAFTNATGSVGQKATALRWLKVTVATGSPTVRIYACKQSGTSRLLFTQATTAVATLQTFDFSDDNAIVTLPGERMVIGVNDLVTTGTTGEATTGVVIEANYGVGMPN